MESHWESKKNGFDAALKFAEGEFTNRKKELDEVEKKKISDDLVKKESDAKKDYEDKKKLQDAFNTNLSKEET